MNLDDIPADVTMTLTPEINRAFRAAGCRPTCHACNFSIKVGEDFQLLSFDGRDQMVCHRCNREDLERIKKEREPKPIVKTGSPQSGQGWNGRGYSRPSVKRDSVKCYCGAC